MTAGAGDRPDRVTRGAANTLWARAFVEELVRTGLRDVVLAPGSRSTPLVMAFAAQPSLGMRVHLDERSASFFALGIGKATGRPAVVLTTSGTAVANLLPAVVEASQSGVPLLVLSADRPHRLRGADANQAIDQAAIFGGYVRRFFEVAPPTADDPSLRHLRALAGRAWAATTGADAGPVHLNFPFDKPLEPEELRDGVAAEASVGAVGRADGHPFTAVLEGRSRLPDADIDRLAATLAPMRGVIVAGPSERAGPLGAAVLRLGAMTGLPVLADPLSGARYGPKSDAYVVAGYDQFLRDAGVRDRLVPGVVLRVGASPTSAALLAWLERHQAVRQIVVDDGPRWKDHGATATEYVHADPVDTLLRLAEAVDGSVGAETRVAASRDWMIAQNAAAAALAVTSASGPLHEGDLTRAVLAALPTGANLVVSSSMPIRDLDAFALPRDGVVHVYANRGASGIDGVVSTAYGIASQRPAPTVCLIGDVAFFHDQNGLLWSREPDVAVVFVLIDNDGGGIFQMLPIAGHDPAFTRYFATPHGIDPRHAAAAHGIDYHDVTTEDAAHQTEALRDAVIGALGRGGSSILRVRTDRLASHARRADVLTHVARSVREALG